MSHNPRRFGYSPGKRGDFGLITVAHFRDPWDAHIFHGRLEAEGIPAFVANDLHVWTNWPVSTALGGVRVLVPEGYREAAEAVLADADDGVYANRLADTFGDIELLRCPQCGSAHVKRRPGPAELLFGLVLLLFTAGKVVADRCTCEDCGARWRDRRYD